MHTVRSLLKYLLLSLGLFFLVLIILAFTSVPFWTWYNYSSKHAGINRPPDYIIVLGGGGMPSESGLMRCWHAAKAASHFTRAKVIIALPGDTTDSLSSISGMKQELVLRGISPDRIMFESSGANTRAEAIQTIEVITKYEERRTKELSGTKEEGIRIAYKRSLLLITSPEHVHRAVKTFHRAGFINVDGLPGFEQAIESDIAFWGKELGGRSWIPDVGRNITLRYQFWTQLHYEALLVREWTATAYYWIKGWI